MYLAIAQQNIPQDNAFNFLEDVKEKFQSHAGDRARSALANEFDADFGEVVLKNGMMRAMPSQIVIINEDMRQVKELMVQAIGAALQRGVMLDDLDDKIDDLLENANTFKSRAVQIQRHMWYVLEVFLT